MSTDLDEMTRRMQTAVQGVGQQIEAFLDAAHPQRVRAREELARLGHQGQRSGWYPERPKRRRKK